jgi:hypothetical protein
MAELSIMLLIAIAAKKFVARYKRVNPDSNTKPFVCVGCMAFWLAVITLPFFDMHWYILPTHLLAIFYDNQTMA